MFEAARFAMIDLLEICWCYEKASSSIEDLSNQKQKEILNVRVYNSYEALRSSRILEVSLLK